MLRWQTATAAALAVAFVATGVALVAETRSIEMDVGSRAAAALAGEATSWAALELSGRDVALLGSAPTEDLRTLAAERLDRVFGVRSVDASGTALLPEEKPYVVTLTRGGDTVLVGGLAPSEPAKRRFLDTVHGALPDLSVADALTLARGMPDDRWPDVLGRIAPLAGHLANGRVMLKDRDVSVEGEAASNQDYERIAALRLPLPDGYTLLAPSVVRPVASPFQLSAVRERGRVTLSGYAPDAETRAALVAMARGNDTAAEVNDTVDLASGAPRGFAEAAVAAVDFLDLFAEARIDVVDDRISLTGTAASPEAYRTLNSHIAAFQPEGFTVEASVDLPVVKPFMLTATRAGPKVTVSGFAPSPAAIEDVRRAAEQVAGPGGTVVEATLANGAPADFAGAAAFAVRLLEHVADGSVVIADTRITLAGKAASSGDLLEIDASVALETPDGYTVETAVQPPLVSPYTWSLERTEDSMILSGHVPSEGTRVAVRDAADDAAGDLAVTDRTALAEGLPAGVDLSAVAAFAATEVGKLDEGRVDLVDRRLSVTGRTADALAGRSVIEAFDSALPAGVEKGTVAVEAPAPLEARIERTDGAVTVTATVPDEASGGRLETLARRLFGAAADGIRLTVTPGLRDGAEAAIAESLRAAALLRTGAIRIDDADVSIEGIALTAAAVELLDTDTVAAMPEGFVTRTAVAPPPAPVATDEAGCRAGVDEALSARAPVVPAGSEAPDPDSLGAVHALAAAMLACGDRRFTVESGPAGGAPAADGPAVARARAFVAALEKAGVPAGRMTAVGLAGPDGADDPRLAIRVEPPATMAP